MLHMASVVVAAQVQQHQVLVMPGINKCRDY